MNTSLEYLAACYSSNKNESVAVIKEESSSTISVKPQRTCMEFSNLSSYVDYGIIRRKKKRIINNIHGTFANGSLVAILGPSGAGKTTLLNILSGYVTHNVDGEVLFNGKPQHLRMLQYRSCYVTQEGHMHALLTVGELMMYAANFKQNSSVSDQEKNRKVSHLLKLFNIDTCMDTKIANLCGGEKKRLSIALELINNPDLIFLDEPTSGLDSLAAAQCIEYLKILTSQGATVVCTIHQPSASIFSKFDQVYILSDGRCLYQGRPDCLVAHLKELDLQCPHYHNPADYIIEVACGEYGQAPIDTMIRNIDIGKVFQNLNNHIGYEETSVDNIEVYMTLKSTDQYHFYMLLHREFTKAKRNLSLTYLRLIVAVMNSLLLGIVFWQVGNDGSKIWFNYNGILGTVLHFMMPSLMLTVLYFPTEIPVIKNEIFNKWYSLKAYYFAICIIDLPISIVYCSLSSIIIYPMTGQPMELYRFEMWFFINFLVTLVAQSLGLLIGSVVNVVNGAFVASAVSFPFLMLAGFGVTYRDLNLFFYTCTYLSYLRFGVEGLLGAVYGYNRKPLDCPKDICFYKYAQTFLDDMYLSAAEYPTDVTVLCGFAILFKLLGYYCLKWRIRYERQ